MKYLCVKLKILRIVQYIDFKTARNYGLGKPGVALAGINACCS